MNYEYKALSNVQDIYIETSLNQLGSRGWQVKSSHVHFDNEQGCSWSVLLERQVIPQATIAELQTKIARAADQLEIDPDANKAGL
jgi:hypothetical protein